MNDIVQAYNKAKQELCDHVGYSIERLGTYAIEDYTDEYWSYYETKECYMLAISNHPSDILDSTGYESEFEAPHTRLMPEVIFQGFSFTMIFVYEQKSLFVFDNDKRLD